MRTDRHLLILALAAPALLGTLSMLFRTELLLGDTVRRAVEARATALGADIEIVTVSPSGLWSVELRHVSARIPRGDFALELDADSVVVTPTFATVLGGELQIEEIEIRDGVVAIVPWEEPPQEQPAQPPESKNQASQTRPTAKSKRSSTPSRPEQKAIEVTLRDVDVTAYSERYRALPLRLSRLEFDWRRGAPIRDLAGYGRLPDGVAFSIVAEDDAYRLRPQSRTRVDRWVMPREYELAWPVAISTRDVRICLDCRSVVALEDVEITLPLWRDDVSITAPIADVRRRGSVVGLGAPEMAIVDSSTRDFAVRLTEADFRYALDSGRLEGEVELADPDGGTLGTDWTWDGEDFDVTFAAERFQLSAIWHLVGLGDLIRPTNIDGSARLGWDLRLQTVGFDADAVLEQLVLRNPWTSEVYQLEDGRFELDAYFDLPGRALSVRRAALTLGDARPLEASLLLLGAGDGVVFEGAVEVVHQDAATLLAEIPAELTTALDGTELGGSFGFRIEALGHSAYPESLVLRGEIDGDVEVLKEATTANPQAIASGGPLPGWSGTWSSLGSIPRSTWEIVLAAEDAKFMQHAGFDWAGLQRAMVHNLRVRRPERGGSTISQQVAKNVFLDGERTMSRKLQEAYLTWRLEETLSKRRILEIYLNIAQWGRGTRGITAAAERYFNVAPRELEVPEVALLAAILPNPHRFGRWIEQGQLSSSRMEKIEHILSNLRWLKKITPAQYTAWWGEAQQGTVGRLQLTICDDDGETKHSPCSR